MRIVKHLIVQTFIAETTAIGANLIVVFGTSDTQVKLPGAAEAGAIAGITITAAAAAGDIVDVCMLGWAELVVLAASPNIAKGDAISIHGTTGKGRQWTAANAKHAVGYAAEAATADNVRIAVSVNPFSPPAS